MKRSILCGLCAVALAFSVGCGKKDDKAGGDKAGETKPADTTAAGGETKPAEGGEAKPAEGAAPAGGADTASVCAKLEELANKGGDADKKIWEEGLKADCAKEIDEQRGKKGEQAITDFKACLDKQASLSAAMDACKQID